MNYSNIIWTGPGCVIPDISLNCYGKLFDYSASKVNSFVPFVEKTIEKMRLSKQKNSEVKMYTVAEASFAEIWNDPEEDIWDEL